MIARWFYLPSLLFLLLALLSGTWLRMQWGWPQWQVLGLELPWALFFRAEFLLHGHSHVALLGWTFLALAGLVLETGTRRFRLPVRSLKVTSALIILTTFALFIAFVRDGYAPIPITLSTVHMLLGYVFAWIFFRHARSDGNIGSRYFLEGAVFWMVMASAGPWLLAAGRGLPPFWLDTAVHFYLHLLFNGWLLFGLAGLSWRYLVDRRFRHIAWPFWLMMAGLLPALLPQLGPDTAAVLHLPGFVVIAAGITGNVLFATGGMAVVVYTLRSISTKKRTIQPGDSLLWFGLAGSLPLLLLPVLMAIPSVHAIWTRSDFLVIGFIHLHLLAVVTSLLLYAILRRTAPVPLLDGSGNADHSAPVPENRMRNYRILLRTGILFYIAGILAMVSLLILTGILQLSGLLPPYPVQKTLFHTGLLTLIGASLTSAALILRYLK